MTEEYPNMLNPRMVDGFGIDIATSKSGKKLSLDGFIYISDNYRFPSPVIRLFIGKEEIYSCNVLLKLKRVKGILKGDSDVLECFMNSLKRDRGDPRYQNVISAMDAAIRFLSKRSGSELINHKTLYLFNRTYVALCNRIFEKRRESVRRCIKLRQGPFKFVQSFIYQPHDYGLMTSFDMVTSKDVKLPWVCCIVEVDNQFNREFEIDLTEDDFELVANGIVSAQELCISKGLFYAKSLFGENAVQTKIIETIYNRQFEVDFNAQTERNKVANQEIVTTYLEMKK
jgi:hypothetical protein